MPTTLNQLNIATEIARQSPLPLDRLPYTEEFEALYTNFVSKVGRSCSKHECYWSLLDARKRGLVGPRPSRGSANNKYA